jgi:hypothetical protein
VEDVVGREGKKIYGEDNPDDMDEGKPQGGGKEG